MEFFAATAPGLESIALGELKRLGVKAKAETGGVSYRGDPDTLYATNLWLRTPSRIVVRIARFHASTFHELERRAKHVPWAHFLAPNANVRIRVTCRKSRLYHSDAVAERLLTAITAAVPGTVRFSGEAVADDYDVDEVARADEVESNALSPAQLFIARIVDDECEVSADTSGELLHRRGYRQEIAKAPLRETLAAAMVLASGWKPSEPLIDPLCGSGTILIEAALVARGIAPGLKRRFAFMDWPGFDAQRWREVLDSAEKRAASPRAHLELFGADRDKGAIDAARNNAERAGVAGDIRLAAQPLAVTLDGLASENPGWVLTNPPYGVRMGDGDGLRDLYARLGSSFKTGEGWRLGILTSDADLARQTGLPLRARFSTRNGGIPVAFFAQEKTSASRERPRKSRVG